MRLTRKIHSPFNHLVADSDAKLVLRGAERLSSSSITVVNLRDLLGLSEKNDLSVAWVLIISSAREKQSV